MLTRLQHWTEDFHDDSLFGTSSFKGGFREIFHSYGIRGLPSSIHVLLFFVALIYLSNSTSHSHFPSLSPCSDSLTIQSFVCAERGAPFVCIVKDLVTTKSLRGLGNSLLKPIESLAGPPFYLSRPRATSFLHCTFAAAQPARLVLNLSALFCNSYLVTWPITISSTTPTSPIQERSADRPIAILFHRGAPTIPRHEDAALAADHTKTPRTTSR